MFIYWKKGKKSTASTVTVHVFFFIGVNNLLYQKIKHFRDKNIFISEQWPNLKNKRFWIEESKEFRIKIIWQGVYIKYKTLESFSINKHHTTTSYKIFCGKQSSSADSYVTYLDPITMLRNIEGKKRTIFKLEYLLLRLI